MQIEIIYLQNRHKNSTLLKPAVHLERLWGQFAETPCNLTQSPFSQKGHTQQCRLVKHITTEMEFFCHEAESTSP